MEDAGFSYILKKMELVGKYRTRCRNVVYDLGSAGTDIA